ncbi:hypothetical protein [Flavobacterium magnesitis]|uniref:hypothetical protein n=1 Tax=Flavobacterium magnesitis TaxID=3138077 RepID=UPI00358E6074
MKRIVIVAVLFVNAIGFSQNKNFIVEDNLIVWRLVYEDASHFSALKNNLRLDFVSDSTGYISKTNFADRKLEELTADFRIEAKEGKYRVSVFNIRFYDRAIRKKEAIQEYAIESHFLKNNGEIRKSILGYNVTELLNPHFEELFTIKKGVNSDW